jgi:PAS domain S-box-containing protein
MSMNRQNAVEDFQQRISRLEQELADCRERNRELTRRVEDFRRRSEQTGKSEKIYRSIIDSSADAIAIFDLNGKMTYVSPSFTKVFGWTKEEVVGKRIPFLPESEKEKTAAMVVDLTLHGTPCYGLETKRYKKDGTLIDVSISASRFHDPDGKPEGMFVILHDMSERKRLQNQLLQAQKMQALGTLAGGIAHDFNNIIFNIIGYTEMVKTHLDGKTHVRPIIDEILRAADRATDLVRHIRAFSRQRIQNRRPIQIEPVIAEALKLLEATVPPKVEIRFEAEDGCGAVMAEPVHIHQIIMNLGTNAFHAMRGQAAGSLKVTVARRRIEPGDVKAPLQLKPGAYVVITVADTGHGIDAPIIERIFDPFFTTKGPGDGTGMGLSVVHGIVRDCAGHIDVSSRLGAGTTFTLHLPESEPVENFQAAPPPAATCSGTEQILVIDDEEQNVQLLQQILERLGYQVTGRTGGVEALATFRDHPEMFDLVISDLTMPNLTGLQLAREVSEIRPGIPIILCTGFSETVSPENAEKLGIRGVIMKPAITAEIAEIVRSVLDAESGASRYTLLLVDDDPKLRLMLRMHLERAGFKILDAPDGASALEILKAHRISLVLTDVRMPGLDGFELMAHLGTDYPSVPVIVMSAYGTPETRRRFEEMGSLQVLDKPIDLQELKRRITESLQRASHGGTLSGISVANFLQLIAMEEKSCMLEIYGRHRNKGALYFKNGKLVDARCNSLQGEAAALESIAWDNVLLNLKPLPKMTVPNRIDSDLTSLILESLKRKDESG